jgi:putative acetyltransferase
MRLYSGALHRERVRAKYTLRAIRRSDNLQVAALIRTVMPEFGAVGPGFAILDREVDEMFETYSRPRSAFFVVGDGNRIVGGGGIAPLAGANVSICELRKMYFLKEARGLGLGQALISRCLDAARNFGFKQCYLETLKAMTKAAALYARNGFQPISSPLGTTGHFKCDAYYGLDLAKRGSDELRHPPRGHSDVP